MVTTDSPAEIPRIPWAEFQRTFRWSPGEHVSIIAPTGAGKTHLERAILPLRKYVIFFGTKVDDPEYRKLLREGFDRIESVSEIKPWMDKVLLWPRFHTTIAEFEFRQRAVFQDALNTVVKQGSWTLVIDEAKYLAEKLRLRQELTFAFEQLRSIKATIIAAAQRPASIPLSMLTNASHVFLWKTGYADDAKRLADIGGIDSKMVASVAKTLDSHEWIYIRSRGTESQIVRSQVRK